MEKSSDYYPCFPLTKCSYGMHLPNDRISSLPVEVLLIILSFLPLKETVKTSILSTRWLNLWVNTPVLDFHLGSVGYNDKKHNYFVKRVNHVLQQHKGLYLKEFRICHTILKTYQEDIDRWLEFALARKVEILELDFTVAGDSFCHHYNYVFPDHWFSSGKDNVDGSKSRVQQYNLKFLKSLSLKSVNVTGEAINFFLRNCPFLERLEVVGSNRLVNLVISDPTLVLKYLQIKFCFELKVMSISNFNLVSLDTTFGDLILKDLPMLVELSILGYSNSLRHTLSQNETCLRQLKSLELYAAKLKEVAELPSNLAQMTKLKRLVIHYIARFDESLTMLLYVIKSCCHLEEFVLELMWMGPERLRTTMQKVERLSCENLKLFEFKGYYGRVSDVELIMHVVKNAPRLEKIIINTWDIVLRQVNRPEHITEQEARRFALKHIEDLRESKHIPPHVDVYIKMM